MNVVVDPPPGTIRSLLARDAVLTAYMLGDLDPAMFLRCRWYLAAWREQPVGVVMVFQGLSTPAVLSYGAPDAVEAIFRTRRDEWPTSCWAKIPPEHDEAYRRVFDVLSTEPTWIMGLAPGEYAPPPPRGSVRRLVRADCVEPILELYAEYPGNFFEPSLLQHDLYFGAFDEAGRLAAVAGTHTRSLEDGIAVVGNIVTRRDARGRGFARACTGRLIEAHHEQGCQMIALHVAGDNEPAIRAYRALGFRFRGMVIQARCRKKAAY